MTHTCVKYAEPCVGVSMEFCARRYHKMNNATVDTGRFYHGKPGPLYPECRECARGQAAGVEYPAEIFKQKYREKMGLLTGAKRLKYLSQRTQGLPLTVGH